MKNIYKIIKRKGEINVIKEMLELIILFFSSDKGISLNMKKKLNNYFCKFKKLIYLEMFEHAEEFNFDEPFLFIKDLKTNNLFDKIADIIFFDTYDFLLSEDNLILCEFLRNRIIMEMNQDFKALYKRISNITRIKINKIIMDKLNFTDYFTNELSFFDKSMRSNLFENDSNSLFRIFNVFYLLKKKILNDKCLIDLENNFEVFFDTENFIEDLNEKKNDKEYLKKNIIEELMSKNKIFNYIKEILKLKLRNNYFSQFYSHYEYAYNKFKNKNLYQFLNIYEFNEDKKNNSDFVE